MEKIYKKANDQDAWNRYEEMFRCVFHHCVEDIQNNNQDSFIFQDFLNYKGDAYHQQNSTERKVIDFIAGMTDNYLLKVYSNYKM